jgi:16S rRNA A1518/A1519 N6-dimethyltransferase RsmA/KsgA/DIM1 with predicted DNA glycosylase/AP lyase activity
LIKPKKSLGQNFLTDPLVVRRIVDAACVARDDLIIEIGPGTGALTESLVKRAGYVVGIEADGRLVAELRQRLRAENLSIVEADALTLDWDSILDEATRSWQRMSAGDPAARMPVASHAANRACESLPICLTTYQPLSFSGWPLSTDGFSIWS